MQNSEFQVETVFTGTTISAVVPGVALRKASTKVMTCSVFPRPMACAKMQPKPWSSSSYCFKSSTMFSHMKRTPPIWLCGRGSDVGWDGQKRRTKEGRAAGHAPARG